LDDLGEGDIAFYEDKLPHLFFDIPDGIDGYGDGYDCPNDSNN